MITEGQFLRESGMSRETFDQAKDLGLLPPFPYAGTEELAEFVKNDDLHSAAVRREVRETIVSEMEGLRSRIRGDIQRRSTGAAILEEPWRQEGFLSPEGYQAFHKAMNNGQIRIFNPGRRG